MALKNCPFCGGHAGISRIPGGGFSVLCTACGAIAVLDAGQNNKPLLEAGWDRRTVRHNFSRRDDIKPCPFCASRVSLGRMPDNGSILKCGSCHMMVSFVTSDTLNATVNAWNRRV